MAYIRDLTEDKATAVAHLGYRSDGKVVQKQKTFTRPTSVSKARWLKSYHLSVINSWEHELKISEISHDGIKLDQFIEVWKKEHGKLHLRANTLKSYQDVIDLYILPDLGHLYLTKVTPLAIQKMVNKIADKGLARRTVAYPKQVLSSILGQAERWGYISSNPCRHVVIPQIQAEKKRRYYETDEIEQLIHLVKDEPLKYQAIFFIALSGGLRRSEILGLKLSDITDKGVTIRQAKNDTSVRSVILDNATMTIVRLHQAEQERIGAELDWDDDWLFTQVDGSQMFEKTPTQWLKRLCERHDIYWAGFHALRHTSATLLISSGVDIKTVSSRIGHKQTSTTINIYAHMLKDKEEQAAELIGDILHRPQKNGFYMGVDGKSDEKTEEIRKEKSL